MGDIIARFADGRLLVEEDKAAEQGYKMSGYSTYGVPFRIGHLRVVEKVLSIDANVSGYPGEAGALEVPLRDVKTSGDNILVRLRRKDQPHFLSGYTSGLHAYSALSGITSGIGYLGEITSGLSIISGILNIRANVIGF